MTLPTAPVTDRPFVVQLEAFSGPLDTEGATRRIEAMLSEHEQVTLEALLGEHPSITDVISLLIALLELARVGALGVSQPVPFGPILVFRATAHEAA